MTDSASSPHRPPELLERLAATASEAQAQHWAPYSTFTVLAAVETADGELHGGSNVENAAYSLTIHAEMNAIMAALAAGARQRCGRRFVRTVYVRCPGGGKPCGFCRQIIEEFATADCVIVSEDSDTGKRSIRRHAELLPEAFGPADLGID